MMRRTNIVLSAGAVLAFGIGFGSSGLAQEGEAPSAPAEAAEAPAAAPAAPAAAPSDEALEVTQIVLAKELGERGRPVAEVSSFSRADGRIYCVVHVSNGSRAETSVRVAFERDDGAEPVVRQGGVELSIPARPRYRTVARTGTGAAPGSYRCVVRTAEGQVLQHASFQITE